MEIGGDEWDPRHHREGRDNHLVGQVHALEWIPRMALLLVGSRRMLNTGTDRLFSSPTVHDLAPELTST